MSVRADLSGTISVAALILLSLLMQTYQSVAHGYRSARSPELPLVSLFIKPYRLSK
jgi:hypothetical protein